MSKFHLRGFGEGKQRRLEKRYAKKRKAASRRKTVSGYLKKAAVKQAIALRFNMKYAVVTLHKAA